MAKINSKALDPQRYACIQAEQRELEQKRSADFISRLRI